jgi:hypothetical protein
MTDDNIRICKTLFWKKKVVFSPFLKNNIIIVPVFWFPDKFGQKNTTAGGILLTTSLFRANTGPEEDLWFFPELPWGAFHFRGC